MTGAEIKAMIKDAGLYCWEVAYALNMQDSNFSRRLRRPFNDEETMRIQSVIANLVAQKLVTEKQA